MQQTFAFGSTTREPALSRRNLVIEAGAGTGKTTAIVAEVLRLMIEHDDLDPERIVLVTFTEKAAGEIADRIREALEELERDENATAWPIGSPHPLVGIPRERRAAIATQLGRIDALRSQTIHSFCQSLLRTFPIEAGLDPQFKIIEGFERSLLYGQLYDAWLDEETRVHPDPELVPEFEILFAHVGYFFFIRELIFSLVDRRDLLADETYSLGDPAETETAVAEAVAWIRRFPGEVKDEAGQRVVEHLRSQSDGPAAALLEPIAADIRAINLTRCSPLKEPIAVLRTEKPGDSIYDRLVSHRAAVALIALTRRFLDYLDREKRKLGVVDFDDLLLRTLALLDNEDVLARARGQFDAIFVDEFQDTDRTQAANIDRLARDASGAYVQGKTVVVGDPKQSIYGFRRADPEMYERTRQAMLRGGAEPRRLDDQYRSDAPLLDAINAAFTKLFPPHVLSEDPNVFRPEYHELRAGKPSVARALDARITFLHAETENRDERFFCEAEQIAEWIAAHRDGSALDLQRFAILFRRMTKLDDYLDTLDRYDIPYVLPPTRLFLDRRAPVDLIAVLRTIAYPFDRGAEISAARTPYFALTDEEIVSAGAVWAELLRVLDIYRDASSHLTVAGLIDLIIETSGIETIYDAAADGVRNRRHLEHLRAIAFEYDSRIGGSVRQFVDEISRRRREPDDMEPTLVDPTHNALQILTVHAAKGLEFDTVILPDLEFPLRGAAIFAVEEPRMLVLQGQVQTLSSRARDPHGRRLEEIGKEREEAETARLFYVAVTRAKSEVVFVCGPKLRKSGFGRYVNELFPVSGANWPPPGAREVRDGFAFERMTVRGVGERKRKRLHDAELEATLATSPVVDAAIAPPPFATLSRGDAAKSRAAGRNRAAGILLHRVLERWDARGDVEPLLRAVAIEAAADNETIARVRQRLATIARSPMLQRIAAAEIVGREFPIRIGGIEKRIDLLVRESDRDLVIDYKSGAPDEVRLERDRAQVAEYSRAVTSITGRPCEAALWYVDDDVVEVLSPES
ncbi:MAG TPA: UvrD-helicase domain-containing protein [Thermoanaerobaculia bacterium]|nr:UvrD-helicase domain-containing protein [Thermoanaerobaculia bacterium]